MLSERPLAGIMGVVTAIGLAGTLVACGTAPSGPVIDIETVSESELIFKASGSGYGDMAGSALMIGEDEMLVVASDLKGTLHVQISSTDMGQDAGTKGQVTADATLFDQDVKDDARFTYDAEPGSYMVTVSGTESGKATGTLTVKSSPEDEANPEEGSVNKALNEVSGIPDKVTSMAKDAKEEAMAQVAGETN